MNTDTEADRIAREIVEANGFSASGGGWDVPTEWTASAIGIEVVEGWATEGATVPVGPSSPLQPSGWAYDNARRTGEPPKPTIGVRTDEHGMLYPGRVHMFVGETESAKSWAALHVAKQEMQRGRHVIYIDLENGVEEMTARFDALGAADLWDDGLFHHRTPEGQLGDVDFMTMAGQMENWGGRGETSLVIIDAMVGAMSLYGFEGDSREGVERFMHLVPRKLAALGPAVLILDHVTKNPAARGKYAASGSERKASGVDGASYSFEVVDQPTPGQFGIVKVWVGKDRAGGARRQSLRIKGRDFFGEFVMDGRNQLVADAFNSYLNPPGEVVAAMDAVKERDDARREEEELRANQVEVSKVLAECGKPYLATTELAKLAHMRWENVQAAADKLAESGHIRAQKVGRSTRYYHVKPFADD